MSDPRRKRLNTLRRRADHLEQLVDNPPAGRSGLSFDRAELAALRWAIDELDPPPSVD